MEKNVQKEVVKNAKKTFVDSLLSSLPTQVVPEIGKMADITGHKRTGQGRGKGSANNNAEHQARRERLEKLEKQYEEMGKRAMEAA